MNRVDELLSRWINSTSITNQSPPMGSLLSKLGIGWDIIHHNEVIHKTPRKTQPLSLMTLIVLSAASLFFNHLQNCQFWDCWNHFSQHFHLVNPHPSKPSR
ncbi:hypothetical protein BLNAU_6148 [Blattamonas nauphoetae]|uniref:Uncharacterized protein n=1 Tax=Blattamonas nauphoetae TaxID=2049346 RepID=A0ABQ9Y5E7_9EUKA|nr:hypothetical protein BLNAU_6148 [Blattamonas nauphoetae]